MSVTKIRDLIHAQPSVPFTVHTADVTAYEVPHTDFVALSKTGRLLHVSLDDERQGIVDIALVTRITLNSDIVAS